MVYITKGSQQTLKLGQQLAKYLLSQKGRGLSRTICLFGNLGSGKTTFTQGLARGLGIKKIIPSPTFTIVRHYQLKNNIFKNFYHIDLYRLENETDIDNLGLDEIFSDPQNLTVIEWADRMVKNIPKDSIEVKFEIREGDRRKIDINGISNLKVQNSKPKRKC